MSESRWEEGEEASSTRNTETAVATIIVVVVPATQNNPNNSRVLLKMTPETAINHCAIWLKEGRRKEEVRGGS